MQVKLDESPDIIYQFHSFEDIIQLAGSLHRIRITGGTVYHYENQYYVSLEDLGSRSAEGVIAVLAEYGHPATITIYRLHEYGKLIMDGNAVETIQKHFS